MMKPRAFPLPKDVLTALSMLQEAGYEAFVVGGAVRDHLSGLPVHDYDLTTNAAPEEIMHVFHAFAMRTQGLRHGTVTVLFPNMPLEITTYRAESAYPDHRHPDHVTFSNDLIQDCARRDFTMNAICYHPCYGYIDPFNGIDDIRRKKIRTVGDPMLRFDEDALRILRALRFASVYGFTIVAETAQAMYKRRDTLCYIHAERIRDEWVRTMLGAHFPEILHSYRAIFTVFLPELKTIRKDHTLLNKLKTAILRQGDIDILMALLFPAWFSQMFHLFYPDYTLPPKTDRPSAPYIPYAMRPSQRKPIFYIFCSRHHRFYQNSFYSMNFCMRIPMILKSGFTCF